MELTSLQLMDEGEASDCYPGWRELQTLHEFLDPLRGTVLKGTIFMSFFSFLDPKSVDNRQSERRKVLFSDQLFLGIRRYPRPNLLNIAPGNMGQALGTGYPRIALESLYGRRLRLKELEHRVHVIAIQMNTPAPVGRTREVYLGWLDKHTPRSMQLMEQLWVSYRGA
jgi:hypothetical protein